MQLQLRLLVHSQNLAYQQLSSRAQVSFAESIKSCQGNRACEQSEIDRFKRIVGTFSPYAEPKLKREHNMLLTQIAPTNSNEAISLAFFYE